MLDSHECMVMVCTRNIWGQRKYHLRNVHYSSSDRIQSKLNLHVHNHLSNKHNLFSGIGTIISTKLIFHWRFGRTG